MAYIFYISFLYALQSLVAGLELFQVVSAFVFVTGVIKVSIFEWYSIVLYCF